MVGIVNEGNCLDYFDALSRADVMITDPPYRAHVHKNATSQSANGGTRHRDLGFDHLTPKLRRYTCRIAAAVRRWSLIFTDIESATWWRLGLQAAGATYIRTIPWVRWSMPQLSGDRPPQGCELVVVAHGREGGRKHWNGPGNLTHLSHTCLRGDGKHKSEKPLDLMLDLVNWFSDKGELICDPFAGSGTTGLAASLLGRRSLSVELDAKWALHAGKRITNACVDTLSDRDAERYARWYESNKRLKEEKARMASHTAKVRDNIFR